MINDLSFYRHYIFLIIFFDGNILLSLKVSDNFLMLTSIYISNFFKNLLTINLIFVKWVCNSALFNLITMYLASTLSFQILIIWYSKWNKENFKKQQIFRITNLRVISVSSPKPIICVIFPKNEFPKLLQKTYGLFNIKLLRWICPP